MEDEYGQSLTRLPENHFFCIGILSILTLFVLLYVGPR